MAKLILTSAANYDYCEALSWYAERSQNAAERFDHELDVAQQRITTFPLMYPAYDERHRMYLMKRFPYHVVYRYEQEVVTVIAIAHQSRYPSSWQRR